MEVYLTPDLQAKLTRLASEQGRDSQALVLERSSVCWTTTIGFSGK